MQDTALKRLSLAGVWLAGATTLLMMIHICADVALKYLFNWPIPATLEVVSAYYMVASVFLPIAAVELAHSSISVDTVYQFLPRRGRIAAMALVFAASAAVYLLLAWISWGDARRSFTFGEVMFGTVPLVVWPSRFLMPLGLSAAGIVCLWHLGCLIGSHTGREQLIAARGPTVEDRPERARR
jgi:TRAP-type C4-dicarboxylate transport system permease small subunit